MNTEITTMKAVLVVALIFSANSFSNLGRGLQKNSAVATVSAKASAETAETLACVAPEYRGFDFWVGDWDAFDMDNPSVKVAHNRVDRILGGCVLLEDYEGTNGSHGESFTIYDAARKVWHQTWVTNHGKLLTIEGKMENGGIMLSGIDHTKDGDEVVKGAWKAMDDGVRETAVTSTDGGKTWKPWFHIIFRPAGSGGSSDESTVAALDTEYQAAVKRNDAAGMDRILADNFVLVVGSGKTFNKNDLLEEAHSGRMQYEHQEDSEQKVRVWGDTAVVTAKLWEKGTENGKPFDVHAWFSDTYVRTADGWRYAFAQSSLPLPK